MVLYKAFGIYILSYYILVEPIITIEPK